MKKIKVFYILFIVFVTIFVFQFINFYFKSPYDFFVLNLITEPLNLIFNTEIKNDNDILIKTDNDFYTIKSESRVYNKRIRNRIKTLDIFVNKKFKNEIKDIIIFNGIKVFYFKDLKEFNSKEQKFCSNSGCEEYTIYSIDKKIQNNNSFLNNYSFFNTFCNLLLSICLSNPYLIFSYILFFFLIFYFINEKIKSPKINPYFILFFIFLLGIILRVNNLFSFLPYGDEFATIDYSLYIKETFKDPGNPPFFYILCFFYLKLFGLSTYSLRSLPFVISLISFFVLFFVIKKEFGKKTAFIASFLYAINIPLIHYSHEFRCYILQTIFSILLIYYLFKVLRKNYIKYYILYGFFGILAINTHYFEFLLLLFNFIFGLNFLIKNKKEFKNFIITNLIIFLSFIPFFVYCALNNALLNTNFNDWIPKLSFEVLNKCTKLLFGGIISFILSLIFFVKINLIKNFNLKKKLYINYCFLSIVFVFLSGIIISLFRPILVERYLVLLIPIFILFLSLIFSSDFKNKKIIILFLAWIFFLQTNTYVKSLGKKSEFEILNSFSNQYVEKNNNLKQVYILSNCINIKYFYVAKYIKINKNVKLVSISKAQLISTVEKILHNDKNAIIYTFIGNANREFMEKYNTSCYFNSTIDLCLFRIEK